LRFGGRHPWDLSVAIEEILPAGGCIGHTNPHADFRARVVRRLHTRTKSQLDSWHLM